MSSSTKKPQTIFRVQKDKENPYVQINKAPLRDRSLSWKAKGVLAYCLSMPDDWVFYLDELEDHATDGLDSLKAGLRELKARGYLERKAEKENGRIVRWVTNVYETPQEALIKLWKPCGQRAPSTSGFSTSGVSSSGKSHATNNNNTNNELTNNNNVGESVGEKVLKDKIGKQLTKYKNKGVIEVEDIGRLSAEILFHVMNRPRNLSQEHSINAALQLLRAGKWSTPKKMIHSPKEIAPEVMPDMGQSLISNRIEALMQKMKVGGRQ